MNADQLELITAAVDGELSATESRAFRALVASSPAAHALYTKLKADSDRVRALPRVAPPAALKAKILARLAALPNPSPLARPAPAQHRGFGSRVRAWAPVALAASVFLCLAAASLRYFTHKADAPGAMAKKDWSNTLPAPQESQPAVPSPTPGGGVRPDHATAARTDVSSVPPIPAPREVVPDAVAIAPEPRAFADLSGFPIRPKLPPFNRAEARVPFLRPVSDLARDDTRQELFDEIRHEPAIRLDLFVRDTARGVDVFQNAAKAVGLSVVVDPTTLTRLKQRQTQSVVIYTESLMPAELAALFAALSAEDAKVSPRVCDSLHAMSVVRSDETDLKAVFGQDLGLSKRALGGTGAGQGTDPKPISSGTIDSIVKSVTPKSGDKAAVLTTWLPTNARTAPSSATEVKQFLAKRGERQPNAIPAIIVIRPIG